MMYTNQDGICIYTIGYMAYLGRYGHEPWLGVPIDEIELLLEILADLTEKERVYQ